MIVAISSQKKSGAGPQQRVCFLVLIVSMLPILCFILFCIILKFGEVLIFIHRK
jgi:hypothetical protein